VLPATEQEKDSIVAYMADEAPDLTVVMLQKVYSENVLSATHDVWDVHTDKDRWWVITNPTNLYSQDQFPNMDLALTFHIGLCLRIPRTEQQRLTDLPIEPFAEGYRLLTEAHDALGRAQEVGDYQAIGVRCRETLLAMVRAAQAVLPWPPGSEAPKKADLKAWADHLCSVALAGEHQKNRRVLFKALLVEGWDFTNWLTHTRASEWHDAEAAVSVVGNTIELVCSTMIRYLRGVPDRCPACGSRHLAPERGIHTSMPEVQWERPRCEQCGWAGEPARVDPEPAVRESTTPPPGDCVIASVPLRALARPRKAESPDAKKRPTSKNTQPCQESSLTSTVWAGA
jgi:hypothetical protein